MTMKNITYYLGAGASYNSLPLGTEIKERLIAFKNYLSPNAGMSMKMQNQFSFVCVQEVMEVIEVFDSYKSLDIYAQSLSLNLTDKNINKLKNLKRVLTLYFLYEQMLKKKTSRFYSDAIFPDLLPPQKKAFDNIMHNKIITSIDPRYRMFLAHYIDKKSRKFPNNIRIITWNYDLQIELAYQEIYEELSLQAIQQNLLVYPSPLLSINTNLSCLLKLNGTAGLMDRKGDLSFNLLEKNTYNMLEELDRMISLFDHTQNFFNADPLLHFAWENNEIVDKCRNYATNVIAETDTLVVIGYSFPLLNKEIDKEVLSNYGSIKKIYYQLPSQDATLCVERLKALIPDYDGSLEIITETDEFYFPPS
jgi:hypothetical protein